MRVRNGAGWQGYLEAEFLKPVIKSPREIRTLRVRLEDLRYLVFMCHLSKEELRRRGKTHAFAYIQWGERQGYHRRPTCRSRPRWWDLGVREFPNVVWVKSVNESHRQAYMGFDCLVDQRLYEIQNEKGRTLTGVLNSFVFFLAKELHARVNLGEGALDTAVYEAKAIPLLDPSALDRSQEQCIHTALEQMAGHQTRSVFSELGLPQPNADYSNIRPEDVSLDKVLPDRRELDRVVFEALGLTEEEQLEVYRAVVRLVKDRLVKARSV